MKIAFIGAGKVGAPLAIRLAEAGHQVTIAEDRAGSASVSALLARCSALSEKPLEAAVGASDVVFLATPFGAAATLLPPLAGALSGKIFVDCTNPVGPGLTHGLHSERSGSEFISGLIPNARVIKAFSVYGYENLTRPEHPGYDVQPVMPFCGDDSEAKAIIAPLIAAVGFQPLDVGGLVQALHLEHMTLLWIRLVRAQGYSPSLVWAALENPRPNA